MGDSGSMLLGLVNAILLIRFIETDNPSAQLPVYSSITLGFGILLIPLLDVLRVFALRIYQSRSPLAPDRNHLHHLLQNKGLSHTEVTITLLVAEFIFAGITLLLKHANMHLVLAMQFAIYFSSVFVLKQFIPVRRKLRIVREEPVMEEAADAKVYPIYPAKEKISATED